MMKRREFIRKSVAASIASGTLFSMGRWNPLFASEISFSGSIDMVAIKNGEPTGMFDTGIEALGGIKQFVKPNQTVVVKPNIGWDSPPERAANTNPELIGRIIKRCLEALFSRGYHLGIFGISQYLQMGGIYFLSVLG